MAQSDKELKDILDRLQYWSKENEYEFDNIEKRILEKGLRELNIFYAMYRIKKGGMQ